MSCDCLLDIDEVLQIKQLKRDIADTPTLSLLDDFVNVTQRLEMGQPVDINWWWFRATWQELCKRGLLQVH